MLHDIPVSHLVIFLGGLVVSVTILILLKVFGRNRRR